MFADFVRPSREYPVELPAAEKLIFRIDGRQNCHDLLAGKRPVKIYGRGYSSPLSLSHFLSLSAFDRPFVCPFEKCFRSVCAVADRTSCSITSPTLSPSLVLIVNYEQDDDRFVSFRRRRKYQILEAFERGVDVVFKWGIFHFPLSFLHSFESVNLKIYDDKMYLIYVKYIVRCI